MWRGAAGGVEKQRKFLKIRDKQGDTPLHHAAKKGNVKVVELILGLTPDMINQQRNDGRTPLFDALEKPAVVRLLLRHVRLQNVHYLTYQAFGDSLQDS